MVGQVEMWFSILWRSALRAARFTSPRHVRTAIDDFIFIAVYRETAHPFEWRTATVFQKRLHEVLVGCPQTTSCFRALHSSRLHTPPAPAFSRLPSYVETTETT